MSEVDSGLDYRRAANARAVSQIAQAEPVLIGHARASEVLGLSQGELGHAGPPFESLDEIPLTVLHALAGAVVHEGWAGDRLAAVALIQSGQITLRNNHSLGTVSPMAGVVRPGQTVMVIEDRAGNGITYATLAEAGRRVLRFGAYDDEVTAHLRWLDNELGAAISAALPKGGLPIFPLVAQGVLLGDDVHQRNVGGMYAFARTLSELPEQVRTWLLQNPQHFLNYAMAAAKLALDRARHVQGSSIVTAISRNGIRCGIQVAGSGDRWFVAPATTPEGGFFSPYQLQDAQIDLGDSAIMEAYGLGGCVAHASPEIAGLMQQDWQASITAGKQMRSLFIEKNALIRPVLAGESGVGLGLDAQLVVEERKAIRIHTGIAHRDGQTGWIGVGVANAPVSCFEQALVDIDRDRDHAS